MFYFLIGILLHDGKKIIICKIVKITVQNILKLLGGYSQSTFVEFFFFILLDFP